MLTGLHFSMSAHWAVARSMQASAFVGGELESCAASGLVPLSLFCDPSVFAPPSVGATVEVVPLHAEPANAKATTTRGRMNMVCSFQRREVTRSGGRKDRARPRQRPLAVYNMETRFCTRRAHNAVGRTIPRRRAECDKVPQSHERFGASPARVEPPPSPPGSLRVPERRGHGPRPGKR